ncbi:hypothetical protein BaRGS_00012237, partial [Batillaria attramentaria]
CAKWVQNCRREEFQKKTPEQLYRSAVLCSEHFEESQFMNTALKKRLVWNAVPTVFDIPNPPPRLTGKRPPVERSASVEARHHKAQCGQSTEDQSYAEPLESPDAAGTSSSPTSTKPTIDKLKTKIRHLQKKVYRLQRKAGKRGATTHCTTQQKTYDAIMQDLETVLEDESLEFIKTQIRLAKKKTKRTPFFPTGKRPWPSHCFTAAPNATGCSRGSSDCLVYPHSAEPCKTSASILR